ncbi:MAG: hypothetical protein RRB13_16080 [bacterium]|nr:hypothetical protein [bacterium]
MSVPVAQLKDPQKLWYANLVISAVLADGEINSAEVSFLKPVLSLIAKPEDRLQLAQAIQTCKAPPLTPPPDGTHGTLLAAIFSELIMVLLSDVDLAETEREFLEEVSEVVGFEPRYQAEWYAWMEEGLDWKSEGLKLTPAEDANWLQEFNEGQRFWYAQTLVAAILMDRQIDNLEMNFLKMAIGMVGEAKSRNSLMAHVKNRFAPQLSAPPPETTLTERIQVFLSILQLIATDEVISTQERGFLEQVAQLADIPPQEFNRMVSWAIRGMEWRNRKNPLIARVKLRSVKKDVEPEKKPWIQRLFGCFVCGEEAVPQVHFRQHTRTTPNLLGRPAVVVVPGTNEAYDYNRNRLIVCPHCLFTSGDKSLFRKRLGEPVPVVLDNPDFKPNWIKGLLARRRVFGDSQSQIGQIDPNLDYVAAAFATNLEAMTLMAGKSGLSDWERAKVKLDEAEARMNLKDQEGGEECLKEVMELTRKLLEESRDNKILLQAAKFHLILSLYFSNREESVYALQFIERMKDGAKDKALRAMSEKTLAQAKAIMDKADDYKRDALEGLHPKSKQRV